MLHFLLTLAFLTFLFWIGYHLFGSLLTIAIWLLIKLPFALLLGFFGLLLCFTILLIPLGLKCFSLAMDVLL